jgi:tRNA nucleotidyltransferase (CCA-adding enzyme)
VRDALRGQVPRELDLVVEGDAVAVARHAAERVGGTLTVHERFGTATVRTGDFAFDLAGARRSGASGPTRGRCCSSSRRSWPKASCS